MGLLSTICLVMTILNILKLTTVGSAWGWGIACFVLLLLEVDN